MTPRILVFALALIISSTGFSATQVYKKVLPDGSTSFSDEEQDNAEIIMVEPVPTVPAFKVPPSTSQPLADDGDTQDLSYSKLEILSPSNNTAFHTGSGTVEVISKAFPSFIIVIASRYFSTTIYWQSNVALRLSPITFREARISCL